MTSHTLRTVPVPDAVAFIDPEPSVHGCEFFARVMVIDCPEPIVCRLTPVDARHRERLNAIAEEAGEGPGKMWSRQPHQSRWGQL